MRLDASRRSLPAAYGVDDGTRTHDGRNHNPGLYQLSYVHHRPHSNPLRRLLVLQRADGAPGRTRTCDPRLRRPVLYPAELRAQLRHTARPASAAGLRLHPSLAGALRASSRCPTLLQATLVEPATPALEGRCSIQLSYGRKPEKRFSSRNCHLPSILVVGAAGFEPATLCSQSRCATRLRYAPPSSSRPARDGESYGWHLGASI
jgi:hypothetical protein